MGKLERSLVIIISFDQIIAQLLNLYSTQKLLLCVCFSVHLIYRGEIWLLSELGKNMHGGFFSLFFFFDIPLVIDSKVCTTITPAQFSCQVISDKLKFKFIESFPHFKRPPQTLAVAHWRTECSVEEVEYSLFLTGVTLLSFWGDVSRPSICNTPPTESHQPYRLFTNQLLSVFYSKRAQQFTAFGVLNEIF